MTTTVLLSGCRNLSSIPTESDQFILVPPTGLFVFYDQDASVSLFWSQLTAAGFSYYNVYRGTSLTNQVIVAQTTDDVFYCDSLSYDSTYYFSVSAVYENGKESTKSNYVVADPINYSVPPAPANVVAQGHDDDEGKYMIINWSSVQVGDLGGYEIYRDTLDALVPDTVGGRNLIAVTRTNELRDTSDLQTDKAYYYKVIAFDFQHWRSASSAGASDLILDRPQLVSPPDGASISYYNPVVFMYSPVKGATGYILYISTAPSGGEVDSVHAAAGIDSIFYSGAALYYNQLYFWKVAATSSDAGLPNSVSRPFSFTVTQ